MSEVSSGGVEATPAGPTTFADAFAAEVSPASEPADSASTSATAAVQPAQTGAEDRQASSETPDDRSPFIPRKRFDEVNSDRNELKKWKDERAWADHINAQQFQTMADWYGKAIADPRAFTLSLLDELSAHPEWGPTIRSELARRLGTRQSRAESAPSDDISGDIAVTDAQGNVIGHTLSTKGLQALKAQWTAEVEERLGQRLKPLDEIKAEREQLQAQQAAVQFGTSAVQELSKLPLFEEHKAEIGQALKGMKITSDHPADVLNAAYRAYHQVVGPKLQGRSGHTTEDVVADFQRKAQASRTVNPGSASSAAPRQATSFFDKSLEW